MRLRLHLVEVMSCDAIAEFLRLLKRSPSGAVFNPWWQVDEQNDIGSNAPAIRRKQLRAYLQQRLQTARLAVIGEALGYRGGHFSGIAMTSERILFGKQADVVAALCERRHQGNIKDGGYRPPLQILSGIKPRRTSKSNICTDGFSEPTATIVWGTFLRLGVKSDEFVLWNAFPWHSFDPRRGMLSNRMPSKIERAAGLPVLKAFRELFPCDHVVALGKIAAAQLQELGVDAHCIRHPASGGAKLFRQQIAGLVQNASHQD
jgi:hypothetical protein